LVRSWLDYFVASYVVKTPSGKSTALLPWEVNLGD